ncbi:hypothetical protein AB0M87_13780 [Streptomyces sp. NPDC051320]|uniref:hypothetical protein n=1 Tax=Streptomyces sp. NPDC051320 TaxID=3154644 RepID=UPI00343F73AF
MTLDDVAGPDRAPETIWEQCVEWAELLVRIQLDHRRRTRRFSETDSVTLTGSDRPLVVVLLAAALHAQAVVLRAETPRDALRIPLATATEKGLSATLRRTPYAALCDAPQVRGAGAVQRAVLIARAESGHPDDTLLWHRVRAAAAAAVETAGRSCASDDVDWWEGGHTIADVIAVYPPTRSV